MSGIDTSNDLLGLFGFVDEAGKDDSLRVRLSVRRLLLVEDFGDSAVSNERRRMNDRMPEKLIRLARGSRFLLGKSFGSNDCRRLPNGRRPVRLFRKLRRLRDDDTAAGGVSDGTSVVSSDGAWIAVVVSSSSSE